MDLSLMDEEKITEHTRRPCSVAKNGSRDSKISYSIILQNTLISGTDYTCFTEVLDLFKKGTKNCDTCNVACRYASFAHNWYIIIEIKFSAMSSIPTA